MESRAGVSQSLPTALYAVLYVISCSHYCLKVSKDLLVYPAYPLMFPPT